MIASLNVSFLNKRPFQLHLGLVCILFCVNVAWATPSQANLILGINYSQVSSQDDLSFAMPDFESIGVGALVGISLSNAIDNNTSLGIRVDLQQIDNKTLYVIRPLNYRYWLRSNVSISTYLGAANWDLDIATMGYVLGAGLQYRISNKVSFAGEFQYGDKLSRDLLLPSDTGDRPDIFYDLIGINVMVEYSF